MMGTDSPGAARTVVYPFVWVLLTWAAVGGAQPPGQLTITVGPTVQVSRTNPERPHEEVILAAHPKDPRRLIGCSMVDMNRYGERLLHSIAYTSDDGGAHWQTAVESTEFNGDPMCGYGPDGRAYFLSIGTDDKSWAQVVWWMELFRSDDGGRTWGNGVRGALGDRPYLAFDGTGGPHHGTGYVLYAIRTTALDKEGKISTPRDGTVPTLEVIRSSDGFTSWSKAAVGVTLGSSYFPTGSGAVVLSDGSLAALWVKRFLTADGSGGVSGQEGRQELHVTLARPGADLFGLTAKVADLTAGNPYSATFFSMVGDLTKGPYRDRLYVAWTDTKTPRSQILVSHSSDRGTSWSAPQMVNVVDPATAPASLDDYMPTVAVNGNGVVGVTWRRRARNDQDADVLFSASLDGGTTWLQPVLVSGVSGEVAGGIARPKLRAEDDGHGRTSRRQTYFKGGDTSGLAADVNGVFHALWTDQRSGIGQVYTGTITVGGTPR
jgi:hypothetical protein